MAAAEEPKDEDGLVAVYVFLKDRNIDDDVCKKIKDNK
eukprot:gene14927-16470_t